MRDEWCSKAGQQQVQYFHGISWSNYFDNYTVFATLQYARIVTPSVFAAQVRVQRHVEDVRRAGDDHHLEINANAAAAGHGRSGLS
jgi:hypothetical protein